jgi:hypothetical protein
VCALYLVNVVDDEWEVCSVRAERLGYPVATRAEPGFAARELATGIVCGHRSCYQQDCAEAGLRFRGACERLGWSIGVKVVCGLLF